MGEQVCETDVEDRWRGTGVDRDGGCKQGTDMGRQVWGQVEEWAGRGDMCEDGEKWEENDDWRGGRRHRCGKDRTQKQAATNHAIPTNGNRWPFPKMLPSVGKIFPTF